MFGGIRTEHAIAVDAGVLPGENGLQRVERAHGAVGSSTLFAASPAAMAATSSARAGSSQRRQSRSRASAAVLFGGPQSTQCCLRIGSHWRVGGVGTGVGVALSVADPPSGNADVGRTAGATRPDDPIAALWRRW